MLTSLYITAHQPAKRARLTRSSICSIPLAVYIEDGCQQVYKVLTEICLYISILRLQCTNFTKNKVILRETDQNIAPMPLQVSWWFGLVVYGLRAFELK